MSYPQYEGDIKDILTDDCHIWLDADQSCFVAASAAEKKTIKVVHRASGREKVFKNKTEFWGRQKNVAGGWLADQNTNMAAKAKKSGKEFVPWTREDFDIIDVQTPEPIENCLHILKLTINAIMDQIGVSNHTAVLGGKGNFRLKIPTPKIYKGNREDTLRPILLQKTREYVEKKYGAIIVDGIEADDFLTMKGYEGYLHYEKTGKFNHIIASFDKDQLQCPSGIFNTQKTEGKNKTWLYPKLMIIDRSIGELWMKDGKCKGWGHKFFGYQMLCGDDSDNVRPYQDFDIRFGDKSAFEILAPVDTPKEMWEVVVAKYKEWFPDFVEFTDHMGIERKYTAGQWASIIFQLIYMKRTPTDSTTLSKVLKHYGVIDE